ncbi:30S ribosomal protein S9 [Candidatus Woesearchaeota archaeon]|nr:30S ribosomal protein S9 [Candidatus Woesearchaeota archaeon]
MSKKVIVKAGKRKTSVAKATLKEGKGKIRINKIPIDLYQPQLYKLRIMEPLILAQDAVSKVDISVTVSGGGLMSQSDAARLAIARALAEHSPKLNAVFLNYDRQLLVADVRRKEASKPNMHGSARSKKQKSYR